MVKTVRFPRTLRIYVNGINIHLANAHQLVMMAKKIFSNVHLIVGVPTFDGELYEMLCRCRYVDQIIRSAPPLVDDVFLDNHKIDFVASTQCDVYGVLVAISRTRRFRTNLYFQYDPQIFFYISCNQDFQIFKKSTIQMITITQLIDWFWLKDHQSLTWFFSN